MQKCASAFYALSLVNLAASANLRTSDPGVTVGIGSVDQESKASSYDSSLPEYKLTLHNYKGVQYFAGIKLDDQKMMAVYDTGSFEVMAMSNKCTTCKVPPPQVKYNSALSHTFKEGNGMQHDHNFAGGLVVATQDYETVAVGDAEDFIIQDMPFWQVVDTNMKVWMSNRAHFTAIVGLGHRTIVPDTPIGQPSVDSLLERTDTERFAICLQKGLSMPGFITFNPKMDANIAPVSFASDEPMFKRVPVIGKNHWAVSLNEASYNGASKCADHGKPCIAIIDSGTSLIGVPPMAVPMVMNIINSIEQDCSNIDSLPDLIFNLGGQRFALPASAYVIQWQADGQPRKCLPAFTDFDMASAQGSVWILGMPFLRHFYTVFDRKEPSIYVAEQGEHCTPTVSNSTNFFVNSSFVNSRVHQEPALADKAEAMLPSWAIGKSMVEI